MPMEGIFTDDMISFLVSIQRINHNITVESGGSPDRPREGEVKSQGIIAEVEDEVEEDEFVEEEVFSVLATPVDLRLSERFTLDSLFKRLPTFSPQISCPDLYSPLNPESEISTISNF